MVFARLHHDGLSYPFILLPHGRSLFWIGTRNVHLHDASCSFLWSTSSVWFADVRNLSHCLVDWLLKVFKLFRFCFSFLTAWSPLLQIFEVHNRRLWDMLRLLSREDLFRVVLDINDWAGFARLRHFREGVLHNLVINKSLRRKTCNWVIRSSAEAYVSGITCILVILYIFSRLEIRNSFIQEFIKF